MADVIIVGAGPAGLAAAAAVLDTGASVIMVEASPRLGGQFWRHAEPTLHADTTLQHQWDRFTELATMITEHSGARVITDAQVWAIDDDHGPVLHAAIGPADGSTRELQALRGAALIIATGAHDWTLPFPGWDLPGVFTGGAAQALAKAEGVALGERVVVAGAGPFLLPVAASLAHVGADVLGVYEASRRQHLATGWLPHAPWLARKGPELAGYLATLARNKINYSVGRAVICAHGEDSVRGVTVARIDRDWRPIPGSQRFVECDAVCVSHGFTPRLELAIAAGCAITPDRRVAVDSGMQTTIPGVYAAGESTGIGGVDVALAEGTIAGHVAAGGSVHDSVLRPVVATRRRLQHLIASLDAGHRVGTGWTDWLTPDTVICRCEEVSYDRLTSTLSDTSARGLRSLKLTTRVGLGPCQGRVCGRSVEMIMNTRGTAPLDGVGMDRRPIAAPIRFAELAGGEISDSMRRQEE